MGERAWFTAPAERVLLSADDGIALPFGLSVLGQ